MKTEWGVDSPFGGPGAVSDLASAETMVKNMRKAGHEAKVVWRGVTDWQDKDDLDA